MDLGGELLNKHSVNIDGEEYEISITVRKIKSVKEKTAKRHWYADVMCKVREISKPAEALLRTCRFVGIDTNATKIKLATRVELAYLRINNDGETRKIITDAIADVMKFPFDVECDLLLKE